ncbi:conjugal transfer protein TraD [Caballeronia sp. S22]|uniref:conjugal transfer protein TraD n=1 Tax=Caballeronia sp. S22 TaxID=3137182 RepID=UPI003530F64B
MPQPNLLQTLTALEPKTKAAKVREVMPVIEQRIAAGVRIADILKALREGGIDLTEATLKSYLYRYRRTHGKAEAGRRQAPLHGRQPDAPQCDATRRAEDASSRPANTSLSNETDPSQNPSARGPISMQELDRLMKPDPAEQAEKLARYERLAKQQRRSRT